MSRTPAKTVADFDQPEVADKRKAPKEFEVRHESTSGLYEIAFNAGGEVPASLKGRWTNLSRAQAAIDNFLVSREQAAVLERLANK